jgi:hypothetical protein
MDAAMAPPTAAQEAEDQSKAKIFISYSRADIGFADRLEAAKHAAFRHLWTGATSPSLRTGGNE